MKRQLLLLLAMIATTSSLCAQGWTKVYGGPGYEDGYNIYRTVDGGFIAVGTKSTTAGGNEQYYVIRIDSAGNRLWDSTYGTGVKKTMFGSSMTSDRGLMFGGFTDDQFSGREAAIMYKINAVGREQWNFSLDYNSSDHFHFMVERPGGLGYFIGGHTDSKADPEGDMWLVKLDAQRNVIWEKEYDNGTMEHAHWGIGTKDGGVLMLGHTMSGQYEKWWLMKVDSNGTTQWHKVYSSGNGYHDSPYHLIETAEGNFAMFGGSSSATNGLDVTGWLLVVDTTGKILIDKHYGQTAFTYSGRQASDGGYLLAGLIVDPERGTSDMYVVKTKPNGDVDWEESIGGTGNDYGYDVVETDNGYVAVGNTQSASLMVGGNGDILLAKIAKTTAPSLAAPTLISPANGTSGVASQPTLTWSQVAGAATYTVQLSTDQTFATGVTEVANLASPTQALTTPLTPGTRYYWRARAVTETETGPWSQVFNFTTLAAPARVQLNAPSNQGTVGFVNTIGPVRLSWRRSTPQVTSYELYVSTDPNFAAILPMVVNDTTVVVPDLAVGSRYYWRVRAYNAAGFGEMSETWHFNVTQVASGVYDAALASGIELGPNAPNPFGDRTTIPYSLATRARVSISVLDMSGRQVATLVDREVDAGEHAATFDATGLPSGVYLCRLVVSRNGASATQTIPLTITR